MHHDERRIVVSVAVSKTEELEAIVVTVLLPTAVEQSS